MAARKWLLWVTVCCLSELSSLADSLFYQLTVVVFLLLVVYINMGLYLYLHGVFICGFFSYSDSADSSVTETDFSKQVFLRVMESSCTLDRFQYEYQQQQQQQKLWKQFYCTCLLSVSFHWIVQTDRLLLKIHFGFWLVTFMTIYKALNVKAMALWVMLKIFLLVSASMLKKKLANITSFLHGVAPAGFGCKRNFW